MTAKSIVAVVAGVLVAAAVTCHFVGPSPATPAANDQATGEPPALTVAEERSAHEPATTQHSVPAPATSSGGEPDAQTAYQPEVGEVEFEVIDGLRVKKDHNCTVQFVRHVTLPDGTVVPVYRCEPNEPGPADIYTTYSSEALKTLAYSDPHAAHVLSLRLREKDFSQAIDYALRSSVLADNTNSVRWLLNNYPTPTYDNDQLQPQAVKDNYILSGIIYALGGPGDELLRWTSIAHQHAGDGIDTEALDARIAELMGTVESIRSEVGIE